MGTGWLLFALACVSPALLVWWRLWAKTNSEQPFGGQRLNSAVRFCYFIGLPYLVVTTGVLPPRFLGLKGLENFISIRVTEGVAVTLADLQKAVTVLLLESLVDGRAIIGVGLLALLMLIGLRLGLARLGLELAADAQRSTLDALYNCLHWAFYRGIFWVITGDLYSGVVWGAVWVIGEGALVAWTQKDWQNQSLYYLTSTIILILTATIFYYSPNLWLLSLVHLGLVAVINAHPAGKTAGQINPQIS